MKISINWKKIIRLIVEPAILLALLYFLLINTILAGNIAYAATQPWVVALFLMIINVIYIEYFFPSPRNGLINALNCFIIAIVFLKPENWTYINAILSFVIIGLVFLCALIYLFRYKKLVKLDLFAQIATKLGSAKIIFPIIAYISFIYFNIEEKEATIKVLPLFYLTIFMIIFYIITTTKLYNKIYELIDRIGKALKGKFTGLVKWNLVPNIILADFSLDSGIRINDLVYFGDYADIEKKEINENYLGIVLDIMGILKEDIITARLYLLSEPQRNIDKDNNISIKENKECYILKEHNDIIAKIKSDKIKYYWSRKDDIVGLVAPHSTINILMVDILKHQELSNAELVSVIHGNPHNPIRYQIIEAETWRESEEEKKDYGYTKFTAYQLGRWKKPTKSDGTEDNTKFRRFFEYQWVPQINSLVFKWNADHDERNIEETETDKSGCSLLGRIPKSNLPIYIRLKDIVSHHTAILGVTGSGKSTLVHRIIARINDESILTICIDITGEYKLKIRDNVDFFDDETKRIWEVEIGKIENAPDRDNSAKCRIEKASTLIINSAIASRIQTLRGLHKIAILEISDIANTKNSIDCTQYIIQSIIEYAKSIYLSNISKSDADKDKFQCCLILEEAHTLVPENLGVGGDYGASKAVIDKISQIALQGRKYNVGFILISQRTATVKKTVLNQCNTMISFRAYDETSFNFLTSYYGEKYVKEISHLKNDGDSRYVIAAGKAVIADRPIIVEIKEREEEHAQPATT